jgi:hypothetical protein
MNLGERQMGSNALLLLVEGSEVAWPDLILKIRALGDALCKNRVSP